jgi:hypothetical protein
MNKKDSKRLWNWKDQQWKQMQRAHTIAEAHCKWPVNRLRNPALVLLRLKVSGTCPRGRNFECDFGVSWSGEIMLELKPGDRCKFFLELFPGQLSWQVAESACHAIIMGRYFLCSLRWVFIASVIDQFMCLGFLTRSEIFTSRILYWHE